MLGNFNAHQTELKKFADEIFVEDAFLVHLPHQRPNFDVGKLANVVAEKNLVFGKGGQRRGNGGLQGGFGHASPFTGKNGKPTILALFTEQEV